MIEPAPHVLNTLKKARKEGLPIAEWRKNALFLFEYLCDTDQQTGMPSYDAVNFLSKEIALECVAELDCYFNTFGFTNQRETDQWHELSRLLRKIYE
ncbi:MAG: hypothetical protein E3K37_03680 [Candidatus Kuenenia sp.]|nr:hypothetical protein [Candidatus Kuenenia hertensis]